MSSASQRICTDCNKRPRGAWGYRCGYCRRKHDKHLDKEKELWEGFKKLDTTFFTNQQYKFEKFRELFSTKQKGK